MKVYEAIDRIRFNTSTLDDLSNKSINTLFNNRAIVYELMYALDKYASITLGIEGVYWFPLNINVQSVSIPPLALRTRTYRAIWVYIQGRRYPMSVQNLNSAAAYFPYPVAGIPNWVIPWKDSLYIYPTSSANYQTTTLTEDITATQTEIPILEAGNFLVNQGSVTIGSEIISYNYASGNVLYGCERGIQDTTATSHKKDSVVLENNCQIFYYKKNFRIPITNNDFIPPNIADKTLEVVDEHMEMIIDYATFKLLYKLDANRASAYKQNFDEWFERTKVQLDMGRSKITNTADLRDKFWFEDSAPLQNSV